MTENAFGTLGAGNFIDIDQIEIAGKRVKSEKEVIQDRMDFKKKLLARQKEFMQ